MKKIVLTFGLISGALASLMMSLTVPFAEQIGFGPWTEVLGYAIIVLSLLLVFFGIRSYRDNASNGQITFTKAFTVGISITLISCVCYVITWEIIYFNFLHGFMDSYGAHLMEKARASGASPAALQAQLQDLNRNKDLYENLFYNSMLTFLEPFPVGLVITLIAAAVLRKKEPPKETLSRLATT